MSKLHLWVLAWWAGLGSCLAVAQPGYPPPLGPPAPWPAWQAGPWPGPGVPFGPWPGYGQAWQPTRPSQAETISASKAPAAAQAREASPSPGEPAPAVKPPQDPTAAGGVPETGAKEPRFRPWTQTEPAAAPTRNADAQTGQETHFRPGLIPPSQVPHPEVRRTRDGFLINGEPPVFRPLPSDDAPQDEQKKTDQHQPLPMRPAAKPVGV